MTIAAYLDSRRKNVLTQRQSTAKARTKLYDDIRNQGRSDKAEGGEQASKGDERVDVESSKQSGKQRKKNQRLQRDRQRSSRTTEKPSVQHSVQRSDTGLSTPDTEQRTGPSGVTGDLLSQIPGTTGPTVEAPVPIQHSE